MRPVHFLLFSVPIVCFSGALLTDLAYWSTAEMMWADFSAWLVSAGLIAGILAAIAGLTLKPVWPQVLGAVLVLVLALFDTMVHSREAWSSVVPAGLILSAASVVAMIATGWMGRMPAHRRVPE